MADKSWLLNAAAIRVAKKCIQCVQDELDVKLKLSHPDFMQLLHEYVELTDSQDLADAYTELLSFVGVGQTVQNLKKKEKVVPIAQPMVANSDVVLNSQAQDANATVQVNGKTFALYRDGKKFHGLYRGQPSYR